ncbi:hypothetical protein [Nocardioides sp. HB32]
MLDAARKSSHLGAGRAVAVGALAAGVAAAWLPFLTLPLSPDEGGFLMVAGQWAPGSSLYGDYWVDRPPLLITLFQIADLAGGAVPLRLLGIVAAVASVLLAASLGRLLAPGQRSAPVAAAATAAVFLATPFFGTTEVDGELLAVPFVLAGLVALVRGWWWPAGVLAVAAAAVKQSEADVVVAALVVAAQLLWQRRPADCLRAVAAFSAGAVSALALVLWWAAVHGTDPAGLWDAVVTFRGQAAEVISSSASEATDQRAHGVATSFVVSGAAGLLLVALVPGRRRHRPATAAPVDVRLLAGAVLAWEVMVVLAGGSYWLHYLLATVPGLVLLVIVTVRYRPQRWRWTAAVLGYAGVTAAAAVVALAVTGPRSSSDVAVEQYLTGHEQPGDTGVVAFGDPAILQGAGLSSPYPLLWSLPVRVRDPQLTQLARLLAGPDRPTWVVVDGATLATWGVDEAAAQPVLDRRYELRTVVGDWHVFHLDPGHD